MKTTQLTPAQIAAIEAILGNVGATPSPAPSPQQSWLSSTFGPNWMPKLAGALSSLADAAISFVLFCQMMHYAIPFPMGVIEVAMFAKAGGLLSLGITTKASNVTGGTVVQPGVPVADPTTVDRLVAHTALPPVEPAKVGA